MESRFKTRYEKQCSLYDTIPLGGVLENIEEDYLDLDADKISVFDWNPLIDTLAADRSLKYIAIRSFYRFESNKSRVSHLQPPIFDATLLHRLCSGLASSISRSKVIHCFIFQGFPLEKRDVAVLTQGFCENESIQQLSLEGCTLGDNGVFQLVPVLRDKIDLFWLNLNCCGFGEKGAIRLCDLVQSQSILRHSAAWADSLRYRQPTFGKMPGLRRLTICGNAIGDRAALMFADRLKDDRWLRCLDMHKCDLTSAAALAFIETLEFNHSLVIVDLRKNQFVDARLLQELKRRLNRNAKHGLRDPLHISWRWLGDRSPASVGPGGTAIMEVTADASKRHHRSVRAYHCCKPRCSERVPRVRQSSRAKSMHGRVPACGNGYHLAISDSSSDDLEPRRTRCRNQSPGRIVSPDNNIIKQITQLRTMLKREIEARRSVEERLQLVQMENSRLLSEVSNMRGSVTPAAGNLPEHALEQVEQTIAQFHSFLDFLKEKGMANLVQEGLGSNQGPSRNESAQDVAEDNKDEANENV